MALEDAAFATRSVQMAEIPYTVKSPEVRNAYRYEQYLILQRECSLPDVCIACGQPACGNVIHKEISSGRLWWLLPPLFDFIYLTAHEVLGRRYSFYFPFCPNCASDRFRLKLIRLTGVLAIFAGACQPFLDLLPFSSPGPYWFERKFGSWGYDKTDGPGKRHQSG
jgi:hypothetical protein